MMNELAIVWTKLMLEAWPDNPPLILLENVPRILKRAAPMVRELRAVLRAAGYVFKYGYHDCGELGGLAQHRIRFLLVARHPKRVQPILYQPPVKRVRACGEVLGTLPMPERVEGGPMHTLPRLSWLNWVRLAIIPAGGDFRDIPGVLKDGQPRREVFRRHMVAEWPEPVDTIGGPGSNGVNNVADPRIADSIALPEREGRHINKYAVRDWEQPMKTLIGDVQPGNGGQAVADPRPTGLPIPDVAVHCEPRAGAYGCLSWREAARTVIGHMKIDNSVAAVGDPRIDEGRPILVVDRAYDHGYAVLHWREASPTVAGGSHPGQGAYSVADPRLPKKPESFEPPKDPKKPPSVIPVILSEDGTWHRPLTTYELAMLQGFPSHVKGLPLSLSGKSSSGWRERIGNAVPPPTAKAIAEQMLVTLVGSTVGSWMLQGGGAVWVDAPDALEPGWARLDEHAMHVAH
jgi:site-specific DNA-cytosine methylase